MDTKSTHTMEPKLKETYDRIMGTATGAKPTHAAPPAAKPATTERKSIANPHYTNPAPAAGSHEPQAAHHTAHLSHIAYSSSDAKPEHKEKLATNAKSTIKTDSLIFPIVMGAGGVIFFVFYAIFWMSFLGL